MNTANTFLERPFRATLLFLVLSFSLQCGFSWVADACDVNLLRILQGNRTFKIGERHLFHLSFTLARIFQSMEAGSDFSADLGDFQNLTKGTDHFSDIPGQAKSLIERETARLSALLRQQKKSEARVVAENLHFHLLSFLQSSDFPEPERSLLDLTIAQCMLERSLRDGELETFGSALAVAQEASHRLSMTAPAECLAFVQRLTQELKTIEVSWMNAHPGALGSLTANLQVFQTEFKSFPTRWAESGGENLPPSRSNGR